MAVIRNIVITGLTVALLSCCALAADDAIDPQAAEFFESKVRPLLVAKCFDCHGPEKQRGNLRLDARGTLLEGGDSGAALVPGKPDESLLIQAIRYTGDIKMPPKSKLTDVEIAHLTEWVKRGAPWPNSRPVTPLKPTETGPLFTAEQKAFWAFQPRVEPAVPAVKNSAWPKSGIDDFILAGLEAKGLQPAAAADKRILIRRATFDVTGLPPTPAEVAEFLADDSPEAFARVVDRLLASPAYGVRWGRHWLDVARYADSNGLDENLAYANAFRYRDYVVAAFNKDKPYDLFVREQLAGDLLPTAADHQERMEQLVATGFLALGAKMLAEDDPVKMQMDIIDEQVDTVGRAFLGLTLGCARCHDHKFDPVPAEDYYGLAGIFKSTKTMENFSVVARWQERPLATPNEIQTRDAHQQKINEQRAQINRVQEQAQHALLKEARLQAGQYLLAATEKRTLDKLLAQSKPLGADPKATEIPGLRIIEAEDFVRGNVLRDFSSYGTGIGVLVNKGEAPNFVEYDLEIPASGVYQFETRYAAAGARPCKLIVNGELVKADAAGKTTGSWTPESQTWMIEGFYRLKAGQNTIRLEHPQFFPHIDKLLIAPTSLAAGQTAAPAAEFQPLQIFVRQWVQYLEKTQADPQSPLAAWHAFTADPSTAAWPHDTPRGMAALLGETRPASLGELAARYQELFLQADRAWQELKASAAGKDAKALPDPLQESLRQVLEDPQGPFAASKELEAHYPSEAVAELQRQRAELQTLEKSLPVLPEAMALSEAKPENLRVHLRGSHLTLGKEVPRQFLRILAGEQQTPLGEQESGRLQLAEWLTRPEHPLTSRVMVNRVWQGHFGEGLVRSPDNFGRLGERPSHPELLDWLANRFVDSGWSLKALHRLILLSATYQMSTAHNEAAALADPENRLLWRMNRRRLEVEAIRDALLAVSGALDPTMGGSLLPTPNRAYVTSTANVDPVTYVVNRRSIYLPVVRSALYDVFQAFDFADPSTLNGKRDNTTVAPQALFMMNSAFVLQQTKSLAASLLAQTDLDDASRVRRLYETTYSRFPSEAETARALQYVERYAAAALAKQSNPADSRQHAWQSLCRAVLAANEFVYVE